MKYTINAVENLFNPNNKIPINNMSDDNLDLFDIILGTTEDGIYNNFNQNIHTGVVPELYKKYCDIVPQNKRYNLSALKLINLKRRHIDFDPLAVKWMMYFGKYDENYAINIIQKYANSLPNWVAAVLYCMDSSEKYLDDIAAAVGKSYRANGSIYLDDLYRIISIVRLVDEYSMRMRVYNNRALSTTGIKRIFPEYSNGFVENEYLDLYLNYSGKNDVVLAHVICEYNELLSIDYIRNKFIPAINEIDSKYLIKSYLDVFDMFLFTNDLLLITQTLKCVFKFRGDVDCVLNVHLQESVIPTMLFIARYRPDLIAIIGLYLDIVSYNNLSELINWDPLDLKKSLEEISKVFKKWKDEDGIEPVIQNLFLKKLRLEILKVAKTGPHVKNRASAYTILNGIDIEEMLEMYDPFDKKLIWLMDPQQRNQAVQMFDMDTLPVM